MDLLYIPIIIFTLIILSYITYQDIKYREINIYSLFVLTIFSLVYLALFIFKNDMILWARYFMQIGITFVFILIFYFLGKLSVFTYIGEGDLYAILALSFTNIFSVLFVLGIFIFALFITLLIPLFLIIYNLIKRNKPDYNLGTSIFLILLGYPVKISKITPFFTPLESLTLENNVVKRNFKITPNIEPKKEIENIKRIAKIKDITYIWASPLIPFVVSIVVSYIFILIVMFTNLFPYVSNFIINFM